MQDTQAAMRATLALISPVSSTDVHKVRIGRPADGGYVMLDAFDRAGICYSLGVGPDVSWDLEMARRGWFIYQYDHTVHDLPSSHPRFTHFPIGITHDDAIDPGLKRLDTVLTENGHLDRYDLILKMDIEGHEWDSLDVLDVTILLHFRQIVVEFHGMRLLNIPSFRERAYRVFAKLRQHHEVIHVHGNNFAGIQIVEGMPIADCIELSYVNRKYHKFEPSAEIFPGPLDAPNNSNLPDLFLGSFKF